MYFVYNASFKTPNYILFTYINSFIDFEYHFQEAWLIHYLTIKKKNVKYPQNLLKYLIMTA